MHDLKSLNIAAKRVTSILTSSAIPYMICGGFAVCLHSAKDKSRDIDVIINDEDFEKVKEIVLEDYDITWNSFRKAFIFKKVRIDICLPKNYPDLSLPELNEQNVEIIDDLYVLKLKALVINKANLISTNNKHIKDLQKLIKVHKLKEGYLSGECSLAESNYKKYFPR